MGHLRLDLPDRFPRWATDSGSVIEPSEGLKDTGWLENFRVPAREWNWLHNNVYDWIRKTAVAPLGNFRNSAETTLILNSGLIFDDVNKTWMGIINSTDIYTSTFGHTWSNTGQITLGTNAEGTFDGENVLFTSGGRIYYSSDGGATWTSTGTQPGVAAVRTDSGASSDILIASGAALTKRTIDGVAGTWLSPTTEIVPVSGGSIMSLVHVSESTWFALSNNPGAGTKTHISIDDGDVWSTTAGNPAGTDTKGLDANPNTGRIIAANGEATEAPFYVSDDFGVTWAAISTPKLINVAGTNNDIKHIGGTVWMAAGAFEIPLASSSTRAPCVISVDDGDTWYPVTLADTDTTSTTTGRIAIGPGYVGVIRTGGGPTAYFSQSISTASY